MLEYDPRSQGVIILRGRKPQYDPAFLVRGVLGALPQGARLLTFNLFFESTERGASAEKKGLMIFVDGKANTRGDVLAFQHALEALSFTESLEGPLENLIKPTNASFSFAVTLKTLEAGDEGATLSSPAETP